MRLRKHLTLTRETLRSLQPGALVAVAGGSTNCAEFTTAGPGEGCEEDLQGSRMLTCASITIRTAPSNNTCANNTTCPAGYGDI